MALHERLEQNLDESDLSILPDVHATSAGLKSFCSWYALNAIETLRHGCGGQGYCAYNGLSTLYANHAVLCTWEGDNYVRPSCTSAAFGGTTQLDHSCVMCRLWRCKPRAI